MGIFDTVGETIIGEVGSLIFGDDDEDIVEVEDDEYDGALYEVEDDHEDFRMLITDIETTGQYIIASGIVTSGLLGDDEAVLVGNSTSGYHNAQVFMLSDEDGKTSVVGSDDDDVKVYLTGIEESQISISDEILIAAEQEVFEDDSSNSSEQDYIALYRELKEDYGEIGPRERKQLEREADRLGLSYSQVQQLEASLEQSEELSDEEEKYMNLYHELKEDYGEIGPRERKQLIREADRLGISQQRVLELENLLCSCVSVNQDEEQEYLELYSELLHDYGTISSRERKQLERLRERLGITPERAKLIESFC